jgi:hypothetical protein
MRMFNVGDTVTVITDGVRGKVYRNLVGGGTDVMVEQMVELGGKKVTIDELVPGGYRIREFDYKWTDEMFEESKFGLMSPFQAWERKAVLHA